MTRETKVGLVVGTGIILLIGIVVSDHLASQQRGQQQTPAPTGYTDMATGNPTRTIDPRGVARPNEGGASDYRTTTPPGNGNRVDPLELQAMARNLAAAGNPGSTTLPGNATLPGPTAGNTLPGPNTGNTGASAAGNNNSTVDRNLPPGVSTELRNSGFLPEDNTPRLALNNNSGNNANTGNTSNTSNTGNTRPTEPLIHHVREGETLWAIAEKFYGVGNGKLYGEIAKANHDKLLPNGGVREGVRLVIPNKEIIVPGSPTNPGPGNRVDLIPPVPSGPTIASGPDANRPGGSTNGSAPALRTIKVETGDALSTIASRELGSIRHMQLIIDANRDQISNANDIKAGMTLKIPALPAAASPGVTNLTTNRTDVERVLIAPGMSAKVHTVQPRDTFSSIARSRLGNERRWKELFELNKDKVRSADALREGIVLVLPSDAR